MKKTITTIFLSLVFLAVSPIAFGQSTEKKQQKAKSKITEFKKRGFTNWFEFETGTNRGIVLGLKTVNGFQFNEYFSLGLGVGLDLEPRSRWAVPVTVEARTVILKGKISPVVNYGMGYSINGGLLLNTSVGMKIFLSKNAAYHFNIGFKRQLTRKIITDYPFPQSPQDDGYPIYFSTANPGYLELYRLRLYYSEYRMIVYSPITLSMGISF